MGSKLILISGLLGLLGCATVVITNIIGILVVDAHNPISDTISGLAIGKYAWIQDFGLDVFAVGLIACAIGLYVFRRGGIRWRVGVLLLGILGFDIFLIAEHNQYANRVDSDGAAIHLYCVYVLGILFALLTFLTASGLRKLGESWYRFGLWTSLIWTVAAPLFLITPTGWDGIYERGVALIMVTWVVGISWLLVQQGYQRLLVRQA
ncbi:MAG: DUF998 domain-containing protein [Spirulinaceae cyanobacterium SM2_1_0]|nr:DUF998 domain-containing protein [Spirulinaceae cyanobacterium SM2_1_0]